ncbi:MAG: hypothetical protein K2X93_27850 [Candidatus Obscuribacterales bacterium]|nr:hypothetical protein [Candidatus Obscuribacterales bacterium]
MKESNSRAVLFALLTGSIFLAGQPSSAADQRDMRIRDVRQAITNLRIKNPPNPLGELTRSQRRELRNRDFRQALPNFGMNHDPNSLGELTRNQRIQDRASAQALYDNAVSLRRQRESRHTRALTQGLPQTSESNIVRQLTGLDLDLSSSQANIVLGGKLFKEVSSVEVKIGDETRTFSAGDGVTAAEYIAVKQVLAGNNQSIKIHSDGTANGGSLELSQITSKHDRVIAADLLIPQGVTALGDLTRRSEFRLLGDLNNFGTITIDNSQDNRRSLLSAHDVYNREGALIESDAPLTINARGSLDNHGTIVSASDLTIESAKITNKGAISSRSGVTLSGSGQGLSIDNRGGTISAAEAINIQDQHYDGVFDTHVSGGSFISEELNLNAGKGNMNLNVGAVTGIVNQKGAQAYITAATDILTLGDICLTGDPTFKNSAGAINITGNISVGEALAIIAQTNITSADDITIKATSSTSGFPISLIAGAEQIGGGANSPTLPGGVAQSTTITGNSANGGAVLLGSNVVIDSRASSSGSGGDIIVAAFRGLAVGTGNIDLSGTSIFAGAVKKGNNGFVDIFGGGTSSGSIKVGNIDTTGSTKTATGLVRIQTLQPGSTDGNNVVYDAAGNVTSGNALRGNSVPILPGEVQLLGSIITSDPNTSAQVYSNGAITLGAGASINSSAVDLTSDGNIVAASDSLVTSRFMQVIAFGNIGSVGNELRIDGDLITMTSNNNSIFCAELSDASRVSLTAKGDASFTANGDVGLTSSTTVTGVINVNSLSGDITATNSIDGTGGVNLTTFTGKLTVAVFELNSLAGAINLKASGGNLLVDDGSVITCSGDLVLHQDFGGSGKGKLILGANTDLTTTSVGVGVGNVIIRRGTNPVLGPQVPPSKNVQLVVNGGAIDFQGELIKAKSPTNILTSSGDDITFVNDKKGKIILSGNSNITSSF